MNGLPSLLLSPDNYSSETSRIRATRRAPSTTSTSRPWTCRAYPALRTRQRWPLLNQVKSDQPEYAEARRLTGFLHNFLAIPPTAVPGDSILREYIGDSQLKY